jgi:hypothetical protein
MRDDTIERHRAVLVNLLLRQVEALELETYVGLTDVELGEFYKWQECLIDAKLKFVSAVPWTASYN